MAKQAPNASFAHDFPGPVKSQIADDMEGVLAVGMKGFFSAFGRWIYIPDEECGRGICFSPRARGTRREAPRTKGRDALVGNEVDVARGTDGESGSGVYLVGWDGESAAPKVEKLLAEMRKDGMVVKVREHTLLRGLLGRKELWRRVDTR